MARIVTRMKYSKSFNERSNTSPQFYENELSSRDCLTPLLEYSLFSDSAIQARLMGFFKEKQYKALGALKM